MAILGTEVLDVNIHKSGSDCGRLTNLQSAFEKLYNLYSLSEVVAQLKIASSSGLRRANVRLHVRGLT